MTPDDARILAKLKDLEDRTARLEKSLRAARLQKSALTASQTSEPPTSTSGPTPPAVYRTTLEASASDTTLHDNFTDAPHVSPLNKAQWEVAAREVKDSHKSTALSNTFLTLSQRLDAIESLFLANTVPPGITLSDNLGHSIPGATSIEFVGATISGTGSSGTVTVLSGQDVQQLHTHFWNEIPSGAVDGLNTNFVLQNAPTPASDTLVSLNGLTLLYGTSFTIVGSTISLIEAPRIGDAVVASYLTTINKSYHSHVYNEVLSGVANGLNTVFGLSRIPQSEISVVVNLNGITQQYNADYAVSSQTLTFVKPPQSGDTLSANYLT